MIEEVCQVSRIFLFPGQGSQKKGMGADVFPRFPEETATADAILGYSVAQQCIEDPGDKLSQTEYTQPLLFTVCALMYLDKVRETGTRPDLVAGHSPARRHAWEVPHRRHRRNASSDPPGRVSPAIGHLAPGGRGVP